MTATNDDTDAGQRPRVATGSVSVATWTIISRATGLIRLAVVAAVLGPTFLGNTFQAVNQFPNLTYSALTGSVFTMLLVPPLVRHLDTRDTAAEEGLAGGFLGLALITSGAIVGLAVLASPLIFRLFAIGVSDPSVASAQRRAGVLLFVMVMPQVLLYVLAGTGEAVQNAHGRFALAHAAPVFENIGVAIVMVIVAVKYGTGADIRTVSNSELLVLGVGSTLAVAAHASVQWWGANRVGVRLIPRAGWRNPEVRSLARLAFASLGYGALNALRLVFMLVVANGVAGGVVAFQFALNLLYFPVAITAWPVSVAVMPELARQYVAKAAQRFRDELVRSAGLILFFAVPAAVAALVLAAPIARAVAFGQMATARGTDLLTASVAALSLGIVAECAFMVSTFGAYGRHDAAGPFRAMAVRTALTGAGLVAASLIAGGTGLMIGMGVAVSAATFIGAAQLVVSLARQLPRHGARLSRPVARDVIASALMVGPAYAVAIAIPKVVPGRGGELLALLAATIVGAAIYLAVQRVWHSAELHEWSQGIVESLPWRRRVVTDP